MSYYMRFITDAPQLISIGSLSRALKERAEPLSLGFDSEDATVAQIQFGNDVIGEIEINRSGDGLFDEEIGELLEFLADVDDPSRSKVESLLKLATAIYAVRVLFGGRDAEETLERLDAVWDLLFSKAPGLLQADGEGYYDQHGQVLQVE
jgi:hypothetical protein